MDNATATILYKVAGTVVRNLCALLVYGTCDAERADMVQSIMEHFMLVLAKYDSARGPIEAWAFTVAGNHARTLLRADRRANRGRLECDSQGIAVEGYSDAGEAIGEQLAATGDPEYYAMLAERAALLRAQVAKYGDATDAIIFDICGFDRSEPACIAAGAATGLTVKAVRTRLSRLLALIQTAIR